MKNTLISKTKEPKGYAVAVPDLSVVYGQVAVRDISYLLTTISTC